MNKEITVPAWMKDHPAPAFGSWGNEDAPGVLQLDRHGRLGLVTDRCPGVWTPEEHFDVMICFTVPPRCRGEKLWDLLNRRGQNLLRLIHEGHSVDDRETGEPRGELTPGAEEARQELQQLLDALDEDDPAYIVARHELPEHLFDCGAGLTDRWPGDEPLDAAVARLLAELGSESKRDGTYFHGLSAAELRRVLMAELDNMDEEDDLGPAHLAARETEQG